MKDVSIILVNWNGKADTLACLKSIHFLDKREIKLDVIVVDHNSSDGSVEAIKKNYPAVTMLEQSDNLGFTGGNNAGIRFALDSGAEYVWLLNNDTLVEKNTLRNGLAAFTSDRVGIVGSKIYFAPGREFHAARYRKQDRGNVLWYAGGIIDWHNMYASHRGVDEVDKGQYDQQEETAFITGCSMMIRKSVFADVGLFDEKYFLYLEDLDFCLRTKKTGFLLIYEPKSFFWHKNSGSTTRPGNELHDYYFTRNRLLVGFRYAPVRTKLALVRESVRMLTGGSVIKKKAILDAYTGKLGKQYIWNQQ